MRSWCYGFGTFAGDVHVPIIWVRRLRVLAVAQQWPGVALDDLLEPSGPLVLLDLVPRNRCEPLRLRFRSLRRSAPVHHGTNG